MTAPGRQVDMFGPYPASAGEREAIVAAVFGTGSPARVLQMRAVRGRCPGCRSAPGVQCTQAAGPQREPGRNRRDRKTVHPSRLAMLHECPEHGVPAWSVCPVDAQASGVEGVCPLRLVAAGEDVAVLAAVRLQERGLIRT